MKIRMPVFVSNLSYSNEFVPIILSLGNFTNLPFFGLEPGFLVAALQLADLHVLESRNKEAVSLLEKYLKNCADDSLHIKLAHVFAATYQYAVRCSFSLSSCINMCDTVIKNYKKRSVVLAGYMVLIKNYEKQS
jgi:hypothetical protein